MGKVLKRFKYDTRESSRVVSINEDKKKGVMDLLEELVEDILLRLAVEDLTRYKSVCKSWYSLISTHRFATSHLNQHTTRNSNNDLGHVRIAMPTYWKVPNERLFQYNSWEVVGSSNGLVCFSPLCSGAPFLVSNPRTRELRKLPLVFPQGGICLSFGYDSTTDDYKLVTGLNTSTEETRTLIQVFSLKSNTWKTIGEVNYKLFNDRPGILFNGALYWLAVDYVPAEEKRVILSFDLSREEFIEIPEPSDSEYEFCKFTLHSYVGILDDQLCIFFAKRDNDIPSTNIWVMRSCKGEHFWEKLPDNYEMKYQVVHHMKKLEFTSSNNTRMSFFCDDNKCLSRSLYHINTPLFVPSLVSPSHAKNNKTSVKSWYLEDLQATRRNFIQASEEVIKEHEAVYRREVGESENYYFHEEGNRENKEIVTNLEGGTLCAEGLKNNEKEK